MRAGFRELVAQGWTDAVRRLHPDERLYTTPSGTTSGMPGPATLACASTICCSALPQENGSSPAPTARGEAGGGGAIPRLHGSALPTHAGPAHRAGHAAVRRRADLARARRNKPQTSGRRRPTWAKPIEQGKAEQGQERQQRLGAEPHYHAPSGRNRSQGSAVRCSRPGRVSAMRLDPISGGFRPRLMHLRTATAVRVRLVTVCWTIAGWSD